MFSATCVPLSADVAKESANVSSCFSSALLGSFCSDLSSELEMILASTFKKKANIFNLKNH